MGELESIEKPTTVDIAVKMLYLTIAASYLSGIVWHSIHIFRYGAELLPSVGVLIYSLVVTAGLIFLTHKISQGKNWARVVIALLVVASILGEFCPGGVVIAIDPSLELLRRAFTIAGYVFLIVEFVAIVLLFLGDSNKYFKTKKREPIQDKQEIDAEQSEAATTSTEGVLGGILGANDQRKAATIGGILGSILGAIVFMVVVYITLSDSEEFNVFFMLFLGFIGLVAGSIYGWGFSLIFARRFSTTISVIAGLTITMLLVPVSSFCCLMFALA